MHEERLNLENTSIKFIFFSLGLSGGEMEFLSRKHSCCIALLTVQD